MKFMKNATNFYNSWSVRLFEVAVLLLGCWVSRSFFSVVFDDITGVAGREWMPTFMVIVVSLLTAGCYMALISKWKPVATLVALLMPLFWVEMITSVAEIKTRNVLFWNHIVTTEKLYSERVVAELHGKALYEVECGFDDRSILDAQNVESESGTYFSNASAYYVAKKRYLEDMKLAFSCKPREELES